MHTLLLTASFVLFENTIGSESFEGWTELCDAIEVAANDRTLDPYVKKKALTRVKEFRARLDEQLSDSLCKTLN